MACQILKIDSEVKYYSFSVSSVLIRFGFRVASSRPRFLIIGFETCARQTGVTELV